MRCRTCPRHDFNPRTPCGVRPAPRRGSCGWGAISIHAPLAGCDCDGMQALAPPAGISIHAPLAGCDNGGGSSTMTRDISIHAPLAGCDTAPAILPSPTDNFNPRTPCGVRLGGGYGELGSANFNPRTPCGVRQCVGAGSLRLGDFNPRTPCGVRLILGIVIVAKSKISIHAPLAGCDDNPCCSK